MQKVGSYLLSRRGGLQDSARRGLELEQIHSTIRQWLKGKGEAPDSPGTYLPEDGSTGTVAREQAQDGERTWSVVHLTENTSDGRRFVASISVTAVPDSISVYVTLEAGGSGGTVAPLEFDPRCPKVVRSLLGIPGAWYHGATQIKPSSRIVGFDQGEHLADEIADISRAIPLVVISEVNGEPALPLLDEKLSEAPPSWWTV